MANSTATTTKTTTALAVPERLLSEQLADADHGHTPLGYFRRRTTSVADATAAVEYEAVRESVAAQFPVVAAFLADHETPREHRAPAGRKVAHIEETTLDEGVPMMYREFDDRVRMAYDPNQINRDEARDQLHLRVQCDEARKPVEAPVGNLNAILAALPTLVPQAMQATISAYTPELAAKVAQAVADELRKTQQASPALPEPDEDDYPLDPAAESYTVTCTGSSRALISAEIFTSDDAEHPGSVLSVYPEQGCGDDLDVAGADQLIADLERFIPRLRALRNHLAALNAEAAR
ncbi:hypothetical protein [Streptomyces sp. NPDC048442]|uniref:DUF6907 domain-containing protein n=1 Tax=Streptomyces sp. NPDC048442 TaxID=3154823 RepID=UPI0034405F91